MKPLLVAIPFAALSLIVTIGFVAVAAVSALFGKTKWVTEFFAD